MGVNCSRFFQADPLDQELVALKGDLAQSLMKVDPDELITYVVEDSAIYEVCQENSELRQGCILAALKKYHKEKFFYEEVNNRTADYMMMLDHFVKVQEAEDKEEKEEKEEQEELEKSSKLKVYSWIPCSKQTKQ